MAIQKRIGVVLALLLVYQCAYARVTVNVDKDKPIRLTCDGRTTLEDLAAEIPKHGRALRIETCPPPINSYAATFRNLGVDISTLQELNLIELPATLQATHFEGLSLKSLSIEYAQRFNSSVENLFLPLAQTLLDLSVVVPRPTTDEDHRPTAADYDVMPGLTPIPATMRLVNVSLRGGASEGPWVGCEALQRLKLRDWRIPEVPGGWLSKCTNLRYLEMKAPMMRPEGVPRGLSGVHSLRELDMGGCVYNFTEDLLANLGELRQLIMAENGLKEIPRQAFKSLVHLEELVLADNQLQHVTAEVLRPLRNLRYLELSLNSDLDFCADYNGPPLAVERVGLMHTATSRLCFKGWDSLVQLNVSNSKLTELQFDELPVPRTQVIDINLKGNAISRLVGEQNTAFYYDQVINLSKNNLAHADAAAVETLFAARYRRVCFAGISLRCRGVANHCGDRALAAALYRHQSQVEDFEELKCEDGRALKLIEAKEMCVESFVVWPLVGLVVAAVIVLVAAAVIYKRYSPQIKGLFYKQTTKA